MEKSTELDVKSVCRTNVAALSFMCHFTFTIKVHYALLLNSLLNFAYNNAINRD